MKKQFSEVLEIKNGKNQKSVEVVNGAYPIFGSGGEMGRASDYICEAETVIIGRKGTINNPLFVNEPFWNVDTAFGLCANRKILFPKYLYHFCKSFDFNTLSTTVTIPSLTKTNLLSIEIPLPPLPEQQKIAAHLDSIQSAIDNKKQQLAQLDELVKSKFVEMFGENPVENGKWKVGKIESVVDRNILTAKKKFQKTDIIKYVDISAIDNKTNLVTGFTEYILEDAPSRAQQAINCDDILISTVRPNLRNIAINPFNDNSMVGSSGFCVLRVNETCNAKYLFYCVLGDDFTNAMVDLTTGAAYPAIKDSDVLAYSIAVPPIDLQNDFAAYVQKIDSAKSIIKTQLNDLNELLESKMDFYFGA